MIVSICGIEGSFAEMAAQKAFSEDIKIVYCTSFEDALNSVKEKRSDCAAVPVKTSNAGDVTEVMKLLKSGDWNVKSTYKLHTHHCLLALKGEQIKTINTVYSHPKALQECSMFLRNMNVSVEEFFNTAAGAKYIAENKLKHTAAIASKRAAQLFGLEILAENIENDNDYTIFYIVDY